MITTTTTTTTTSTTSSTTAGSTTAVTKEMSASQSKKKNLVSSFFKSKSTSYSNMSSLLPPKNNIVSQSHGNLNIFKKDASTGSSLSSSPKDRSLTPPPGNANKSPKLLSKQIHQLNNGASSNTTESDNESIESPLSSSPLSESEELFNRSSHKKQQLLQIKQQQAKEKEKEKDIFNFNDQLLHNSNNNNSNSNQSNRNSTNSTSSSSSTIIIKPTIKSNQCDDKTWILPDSYDIESSKKSTIQEIEFILSEISQKQKLFTTSSSHQTSDEEMNNLKNDTIILLEILKQFNFDMVDIDIDINLFSDEFERKIYCIARKMLSMKLEITKTKNAKRVLIFSEIIRVLYNFMRNRVIPNQVSTIPIELTISMGVTTSSNNSILQSLQSIDFKKGYLLKKKNRMIGSNKFTMKWVVLSHSEILVFSNEKQDELLVRKSLYDINSIQLNTITNIQNSFTLIFKDNPNNPNNSNNSNQLNIENNNIIFSSDENNIVNSNNNSSTNLNSSNNSINSGGNSNSSLSTSNGSNTTSTKNFKKSSIKSLTLYSESQEEYNQWILSIDGILNSNFKSNIQDLSQKESLLNFYKTSFKGGSFRFGENEEWFYYDGKLSCQSNWSDGLEYIWDGFSLVPSDQSRMKLGRGRWNGVWLTWYAQDSNEPFLKYIYQPIKKQYLLDCFPTRPQYTWTWSRHFLAPSNVGSGEWITEGDIPPSLVMLVQMLKYYKYSVI